MPSLPGSYGGYPLTSMESPSPPSLPPTVVDMSKVIEAALSSVAGLSTKKVVTHKGRDVYEVLWRTDVTVAKELKRAVIEDIKHIGIDWQAVS